MGPIRLVGLFQQSVNRFKAKGRCGNCVDARLANREGELLSSKNLVADVDFSRRDSTN
jgi:hypothetical protein